MIAYGCMNFVMTVTPLAMAGCGFGHGDSATVIQWHALAMFAPSFFTGDLVKRFGATRVMAVGAVLMLACLVVNLSGLDFANFLAGLIVLGLGWNFLFVGGSTLVGRASAPRPRRSTIFWYSARSRPRRCPRALCMGWRAGHG
jgi:MFS family permease